MVYNHIKAHPGVSFLTIKKVFNLTDSTLRYHLKYLEGENEIKSIFNGGKKCYYLLQNNIYEILVKSEPKTYRLNHPQKRIMDTIKRNPGITQRELILKTKLKRSAIIYNLQNLLEFGIVQCSRKGRNSCYNCVSDIELQKNIINNLIKKLLNNEIDDQTFITLKNQLK
jgi:predicted transcriptional regulator